MFAPAAMATAVVILCLGHLPTSTAEPITHRRVAMRLGLAVDVDMRRRMLPNIHRQMQTYWPRSMDDECPCSLRSELCVWNTPRKAKETTPTAEEGKQSGEKRKADAQTSNKTLYKVVFLPHGLTWVWIRAFHACGPRDIELEGFERGHLPASRSEEYGSFDVLVNKFRAGCAEEVESKVKSQVATQLAPSKNFAGIGSTNSENTA